MGNKSVPGRGCDTSVISNNYSGLTTGKVEKLYSLKSCCECASVCGGYLFRPVVSERLPYGYLEGFSCRYIQDVMFGHVLQDCGAERTFFRRQRIDLFAGGSIKIEI